MKLQSRASKRQLEARLKLIELFNNSPLPVEQLLVNLHLYMRSSVIAKVLYIDELYQEIIDIPGIIMEFGTWWGANLALFQSLRAVYEPYNYTRKVVGFDTFIGYPQIDPEDGMNDIAGVGGYSVGEDYKKHLTDLLDYHELENNLPHIKKYEIVKGDVNTTIDFYFAEHPETIVALAYFDLQLYKPTKKCLEAIKPHVIKGTVIAMDELNCFEFPGETIAFKEVWGLDQHQIVRSQYLPDRSYFMVE